MSIWKYRPFLGLNSGDLLAKENVNKYKAVVATAKIARRLNNVKEEEYDESTEAERTLEAHKVTSIALEMLLKGEIEFYPSKTPEPVPVAAEAAPGTIEPQPTPLAELDVEVVPLSKPEETPKEAPKEAPSAD